MFSRYVGKLKFGTVDDDSKAPEPRVSPRWIFDGRMTLPVAFRILAFAKTPTAAELRVRYRTLMQEHHPDHGGDVAIAAAIIAAYTYVKALVRGAGARVSA